jgi:hypothetical protein
MALAQMSLEILMDSGEAKLVTSGLVIGWTFFCPCGFLSFWSVAVVP